MSNQPAPTEPHRPQQPAEPERPPSPETTQPDQSVPTPPAPKLVLYPGARPVGEYELVQRLGAGGFGEVWKATGPGGFPVALKFIRLTDSAILESELRALELMKDIRHPNVLGTIGAWQRDGHLLIAMELGDRSLHDRYQEAKRQGQIGIPRAELLDYLRDAARGLDYLNSINVQHRDVKPQNFLLVGGGVKVADFGLAKVLEQNVSGHTGGMTPAYAAPEFLQGQTTARSDQYSLGVTYCQLRGGRLPFAGNHAKVMYRHVHEEPDLSMLPEAERPAVARALAKKPEDRWPTCRAFVEALAATPEQPLPAAVETVFPVAAAPVATYSPPGAAVSTMLADWPRPARAPGPVLGTAFVLAALCPLLLLLWPAGADPAPTGSGEAGPSPGAASSPAAVTNSIGMRLVLVGPGRFRMGEDAADADRADAGPAHEVTLSRPFYLGAYEVTQHEYEAVLGHNPASFTAANGGGPEHPVESVTWAEAVHFCERLSARPEERAAGRRYRLPTEAEWEYACRASTATAFHFGDAASSDRANFDGELPFGGAARGSVLGRPAPVGTYPPNAWGLFDLHGNVAEWCQDWSAPYEGAEPQTDPRGPPEGFGRIVRGGSWADCGRACRSAARSSLPPGQRSPKVGFRVAMTAAAP